MGKFFGTDGIRGVANKELTPEFAFKIAKAGAYVLSNKMQTKPKILVAKDTRISCDMLESAMVAGFCSVGAQVELLGVIPTPAVAHLIRQYNADAGVVISASHNSYEFNGIKYFNNKGFKLPDEIENQIEELLENDCEGIGACFDGNIGTYRICNNATLDYADFLKATVDLKKANIKVGIDCANGATSFVAPTVLKELGIDFKVINNEPNGVNINNDCGSTHIEGLQKFVVENGLDIGLAFDGDGDRVLAVDEKGNLIDGDRLLAIMANSMKKSNKLAKDTLVVTVMSNLGLKIFAKDNEITIAETKVGDRYILEEMLKSGYNLGGEQSGHIILFDYNTTGDGILAGLQILSIMANSGKKMSELASIVDIYPQVLVNAKVDNSKKKSYMEDKFIADKIADFEERLSSEGRVLIRPSGTEPLIRVMLEGKNIECITNKARELADLIEQRLS